MRLLLTGGLAAALMLTGCQVGAPVPVSPAAPVATPEAGVASLNGLARFYGAPMAGAAVTAYLAGTQTVLTTAVAGADGKFRLDFADAAPQGALVKLVATQDGQKVASLARVPMRQVLQAGEEGLTYLLDEQRSMVFLALGPRFEALGELSLGEGGVVALQVAEEAFAAFTAALAAVASAPPVSQEAFEAASQAAISDAGTLVQTPAAIQAIARLVPPAAAEVLIRQADVLAVVIRREVSSGKPKPTGTLIDRLPVGDQVAEEVFQGEPSGEPQPSSPSGGGSSNTGVDLLPTPDASGALGVTDGQVLNPTATPSITIED